MNPIQVTVSGSFRRHMAQIQSDVEAFVDAGVEVLSPADPRVVDAFGDFVFVASDRLRTVKPVQDRHLQAIVHSSFLWLVAPDGYVGPSAAMELGYSMAVGVPVLTTTPLTDLTMRQYADVVPNISAALALHARKQQAGLVPWRRSSLLLDPRAAAAAAHEHVDSIEHLLLRRCTDYDEQMPELVRHSKLLRDAVAGIE